MEDKKSKAALEKSKLVKQAVQSNGSDDGAALTRKNLLRSSLTNAKMSSMDRELSTSDDTDDEEVIMILEFTDI